MPACSIYMKHEIKNCPCCGDSFECKVGSITQCQCWAVQLDEEELQFIREKYETCLCAKCMIQEKHLFHQHEFEKRLKKMGAQFK